MDTMYVDICQSCYADAFPTDYYPTAVRMDDCAICEYTDMVVRVSVPRCKADCAANAYGEPRHTTLNCR